MIQYFKYFIQKYIPSIIKYLFIIAQTIRKIFGAVKQLFAKYKHLRAISKIQALDSKDMNYTKISKTTFITIYKHFKQVHLTYFGEITQNSHRFIIKDEQLEEMLSPLMAVLNDDFVIDVLENDILMQTITNKTIRSKKLYKILKDFSVLKIYKVYKNKYGIVDFESKISFEIERWYKRGEIYITKSKNNIQDRLTENNFNATIEVDIYEKKVKQLKDTYRYFEYLNQKSVNEIDLVYTWVNAEDSNWREKQLKYLNQNHEDDVHKSAVSDNRFISRDELKYSLRSVEKYFKNYRKIFIITDNQKPDWLLESNDLIVVNHTDIFPDTSVLPVFNSHAIEACLHHIEGLSEHYLYLNDDIIFGRSVDISLFFPEKNKISIFPSTQTFIPFGNPSKDFLPVDTAAMNTRRLLLEKNIGYAMYKFKHTPLPQIKSKLFELETMFFEELKETRVSRFRQPTDISITSSMLFNYMYLTNNGSIGTIRYNYISLDRKDYLFELHKATAISEEDRPDVFCVNDIERDLNQVEVKKSFIEVMEKFLPEKSKFEL